MAALNSTSQISRTYTVFRVARSGVDPLSTLGSQANGGRYNESGVPGVIYTSLDKTTAIAEIIRGLRSRGVSPNSFGPDDWWVYGVRVSITQPLELEDAQARSTLDVTPEILVGNDTTQTRRVGNYARENNFQAILAPSAAARGQKNLVLFLDRLPAGPQVLSSAPIDLRSSR